MEADTQASGDESDATVVLEYSEGEKSLVVVASDNEGGDRGGNDSRLEGVVVGNTRNEVDDVADDRDEGVGVRDGRAGIGGEDEDVRSMSASREMMEDSTCATSGMHSSSPLQPPHTTRELPLPASPTSSPTERDSDVSLDFGSDDASEIHTISLSVAKPAYTSISYYDTFSEGEQALHTFNSFIYTYHTRYMSVFVLGKVYQCRSHLGCGHRLKLSTHRVDSTMFRYQLLQRGQHCGPAVHLSERGISPVLKHEIDSLLKLGMSAGRVRNMMLFKYMKEPSMVVHVPTVRKMENRKAYLKKKAAGGWEINKFAVLQNWTSHKMCQDRVSYFNVDQTNMSDMNKMIVLDEFEHTFSDNGREIASMGMIVTTRALFSNVRRAVEDQGNQLVLSTDGTYRIHCGGWVLVDCGGVSVESTESGFVQRFRPWLYMFVRTESTFAYERLFRALIKYAQSFFEVEVVVRSASIDHADGIASALELVWPDVEVLTCWEHLLRQARKHSKLAKDKDFIKEQAVPHLRLLHSARSLKQFCGLAKRVLQAWRNCDEVALADWLQSTYMTSRWTRWSVGSSSVPGFLPTQQPIESHHRVIKVIVTDFKKAPTISILNSVLPRVLLYDGTNLSSGLQAHYAEGPLPVQSVMKAKSFLLDPNNHRIVNARATKRASRIYFNTTKSMVHVKNPAGSTVTSERAERFQRSLRGWLGDSTPIVDVQFVFLSLHQVTVNDRLLTRMEPLPIRARWQLAEIRAVRSALVCTCKRYMHSGWVCSHIVASLHLLDKLNIDRALESIPMRGQPGRPRTLGGALEQDVPTNMYDVNRLVKLFMQQPGRPLKWPVVDQFDVNDGGVSVPDYRVGQVAACRLSAQDGVYIWTATFVDGGQVEYKVEELVHAIRRAHDLGTM